MAELHEPIEISFTYGSGTSVENGKGEKYIFREPVWPSGKAVGW